MIDARDFSIDPPVSRLILGRNGNFSIGSQDSRIDGSREASPLAGQGGEAGFLIDARDFSIDPPVSRLNLGQNGNFSIGSQDSRIDGSREASPLAGQGGEAGFLIDARDFSIDRPVSRLNLGRNGMFSIDCRDFSIESPPFSIGSQDFRIDGSREASPVAVGGREAGFLIDARDFSIDPPVSWLIVGRNGTFSIDCRDFSIESPPFSIGSQDFRIDGAREASPSQRRVERLFF
ncbi:hypothetical protein [Salibacterium qingdaonense]|uniref:Uncharacterized protein n=1 Tax=Salibacterium qingdaonense TaxID=266892 RepID=A0A1I4NWF2_9BACI|nr:hypothetical protein [Salibacterium qingdaonense]SFM19874.1 hypothetical protein SAMN04488054_12113 [Salibacterium qingdaonense]